MANKRMFSMDIVDSDAFLDMPVSLQALYFHLAMRADDDGFINNPMKIQRVIGAKKSDYEILVSKRFILVFKDGVIVIKHWRMHNYIQKDRYKPTQYQELKKQLVIKDNNAYTERKSTSDLDTTCIHDVHKMEPQVRLGEVSKGEISIEREGEEKVPPAVSESDSIFSYGEYKNVKLSETEYIQLEAFHGMK